jgi:transposase
VVGREGRRDHGPHAQEAIDGARPVDHPSETDEDHLRRVDHSEHGLHALISEVGDRDRGVRHVGALQSARTGPGGRTGARILIDVGDASTFPTAAHLASYAGLAPATRSSSSSIRGEQPSRRGNKQLKRAFFLSAFVALADPASRAYYDKKISQGKHHTQAILCLARRRADVLFAMLRDGTFYDPQPTPTG